jgi:hypothetical protein
MAPIVVWNLRHDWVAAGQMAERIGLVANNGWGTIGGLSRFLAGEFAVLGLWWFLGVAALGEGLSRLLRRGRETRRTSGTKVVRFDEDVCATDRTGLLYVVCLWAVVWLACVGASLLGETEANWAAPAHVAVLVLIAGWFDDRLTRADVLGRSTRGLAWGCGGLWVLSLVTLSAAQHTEWFYPLAARLLPAPSAERPAPMRRLDPTCRFRGYREIAPEVGQRLAALRAEGLNPFVLAPTYTVASALSFYLPGQPEAYCLSWTPGWAGRAANQHDLWHPNPRNDLNAFRGRPAVVVETPSRAPVYAQVSTYKHGLFRSADPTERILVRRASQPVAAWDVTICRDYRGLPRTEAIADGSPGQRVSR